MASSIPQRLAERYRHFKSHAATATYPGFALEILARDRIGLLADITAAISQPAGDVWYIQSWIDFDGLTHILVQIKEGSVHESVAQTIEKIQSVERVHVRPTFGRTYGKRIIVMGGGAQVAAVASGAIAEADRHNIRGEVISVDTIAVVGEQEIARAVRGVGRLHRAGILVMAGAMMGGEISVAVDELREEYGIPVIALSMAGSLPDHSDLTVADPTEAGVMAVMAISNIGAFDLLKLGGHRF